MSLTRIHNLSISLDGFAIGEPQSADAPFGHAGRIWDGLEALEDAYDVEAVSSPSGVTHLTFTRKSSRECRPQPQVPTGAAGALTR